MRGLVFSREPVLVIGMDEVGAREAFEAARSAGSCVEGGHATFEGLLLALAPGEEWPRDSYEAALERMFLVLGVRTQVQAAQALGVRQSSVSDAKKRRSIPATWLLQMARRGINPDWILTGDGPRYLVASETPPLSAPKPAPNEAQAAA